jgi:hypothetical protein
MDRIRFELQLADPARPTGEIMIAVNGTDFAQLVGAHERAYAEAEVAPNIAGQYRGLSPDRVVPPSRHFLGEPSWEIYRYGERIQILGCKCGEPGCWPLACQIRTTDDRVTWFDFEQPQRSGRELAYRPWSYDGFGPFEFERRQYEESLSTLAPRPAS